MAVKSAYREKPAEAPNIPEEPPQPSETVRVEFIDKTNPDDGTIASIDTAIPEPDEATLALQKQLADLKKSEQMQREYAEQAMVARMAAQPPTREQKLAMWRQQGMTEGDARFLSENPQMVDMHDLTRIASEEAVQQGHELDSDAHRQATKEIFDQHLASLQAPQAQAAQPAPAFFAPRPSPATERPGPASYVSAPVSRGTASYETGQRPTRQIKLTPQDQEYARIAGVSDVEYAKQKQRLALHKANGDYTGRE